MSKELKCDVCDKPATVHLTQIVNNQIHKVDLCAGCAEEKGITDPNGYSLADLLAQPSDEAPEAIGPSSVVCDSCGYTQREFKSTGRLGCPDCYDTFGGLVAPALASMHRGERHTGKAPAHALERKTRMDRLNTLESELQEAIGSERYEDAARYRDEILDIKKAIEKSEENKGENASP